MELFWNILGIVLQVATGLVVIIPLIKKFYDAVKTSIEEKNWRNLLTLLMKYIEEAEEKLSDQSGADRADWVVAMVKASAEWANYKIDDDELRAWIDSLVEMTKKVNVQNVTQLPEDAVQEVVKQVMETSTETK